MLEMVNLKAVQHRYRVFLEDGVRKRSPAARDPAYWRLRGGARTAVRDGRRVLHREVYPEGKDTVTVYLPSGM